MKHTPATPLPWEISHDREQPNPYWHTAVMWLGSAGVVEMSLHNAHGQGKTNAAYIAHAANAYPQLVAALSDALPFADYVANNGNAEADELAKHIRALLTSLGEES